MDLRRRWFLLAAAGVASLLVLASALVAHQLPGTGFTATTLVAVAGLVVLLDLWRDKAARPGTPHPEPPEPEALPTASTPEATDELRELTLAVGALAASIDEGQAPPASRTTHVVPDTALDALGGRVASLLARATLTADADAEGIPSPATTTAIRSLLPGVSSRLATFGADANALVLGTFVASLDAGRLTVFEFDEIATARADEALVALGLEDHVDIVHLDHVDDVGRRPELRWEFHTVIVPQPFLDASQPIDALVPAIMDQATSGATFLVDSGADVTSIEAAWSRSPRHGVLQLEIVSPSSREHEVGDR